MVAVSRVAVSVPKIGLTAEEVTIERWFKAPGDRVMGGETIAEMMTDKAVIDLEAPADGVLDQIVVDANQTATVGAVVAYLNVGDAT